MGTEEKDVQKLSEIQGRMFWFGDYQETGWQMAGNNPDQLLIRYRKERMNMVPLPTVHDAVKSGFCHDQGSYYSLLRAFCIKWVEEEITAYTSSSEARLIRLVLILRDVDLMAERIGQQIHSWYGMTRGTDRGRGRGAHCRRVDPIVILSESSDDVVSNLCLDLVRFRESRSRLADDIALAAQVLLPNCSALTGPLVAARLLAAAGSMRHLSRMPASGLQVIGARNAFFSHKAAGSASPKHGLIFEHKRVHTAPKMVRGRVARTLAAQTAIALRLDYFRKEIDEEFICRADQRIKKAGAIP
ncbi:MAG TPA: hypothetical protein VN372_11145 [Methanospirillum sp.]|nr:hypothetical protein [Methanospirillum sp.]